MVSPSSAQGSPIPDPFGREPFQHSALDNVDKLNARQPQGVASKERLAKLAIDVGLAEVTRWKPRMVRNGADQATQRSQLTDVAPCVARKPRKLGLDRRSQHVPLCHCRCYFSSTRRRSRPAGGPREDPQEARGLRQPPCNDRGVYNSVPYQGAIERLGLFLGLNLTAAPVSSMKPAKLSRSSSNNPPSSKSGLIARTHTLRNAQ